MVAGAIESRSVRLPYEVIGEGDPIVFCHGLGGDRGSMKDLLGAPPRHRLIVWDSRGHGESQPTGSPQHYSFSSFAEDLRGLLDHLDIRRAVIGGVSMGAALAARFASRWPDRVRGLVLVRPAWIDRPLTKNLRYFPVIAELLDRLGPSRGLEAFRQSPEVQELERASPYTFLSLCQHFDAPLAVERLVRLDQMPRDAPIQNWGEVQSLRIPSLVVGNENDDIHPFEFATQWAERMWEGHLVMVPSKADDEAAHVRCVRERLGGFVGDLGP